MSKRISILNAKTVKSFGDELKELRENTLFSLEERNQLFPGKEKNIAYARPLQQTEMAELVGLSQARYNQLEKPFARAPRERAEKIAVILKCPGRQWECFDFIQPEDAQLDTPIDRLPWMSVRVLNRLLSVRLRIWTSEGMGATVRIQTCEQLLALPDEIIPNIRNIGQKGFEEIIDMRKRMRISIIQPYVTRNRRFNAYL